MGRTGRCGLSELFTLPLFGSSLHCLIFWHPKHSATFEKNTITQAARNGWNSERERLYNPVHHAHESPNTFFFSQMNSQTLILNQTKPAFREKCQSTHFSRLTNPTHKVDKMAFLLALHMFVKA